MKISEAIQEVIETLDLDKYDAVYKFPKSSVVINPGSIDVYTYENPGKIPDETTINLHIKLLTPKK